jgi:acyl-coenzyme A thioesterase 13
MSADGAGDAPIVGAVVLQDGPFKGWSTWSAGGDPYETAIGPFCFRVDDGKARCAFQPRREHLNGGGTIHGGALMSFADFSLFCIAHNALRDGVKAVTLTCNSEFVSAGDLSANVEAEGEVLRETRSLIFVRGLVTQTSRPLLAFSGTLKKIETSSRP